MKPSFISLFKRGRYFRLPLFEESEEDDVANVRKEAERFTAAAIGFCMQHNPRFKKFFLKKICGIDLLPRQKCIIDIEPENWADLLIRFGKGDICVVEFKLGAPLQPHQNPSEEMFWKDAKGYGNKMTEAFPKNEKRYVVLGSHYLFISKHQSWTFVQSSWKDLAKDFQSEFRNSYLLQDLADCLAQFKIWDFKSMKTKGLNVAYSGNLSAGSAAWEIVWSAFSNPDLKFSTSNNAFRTDIAFENKSDWYLGIGIQSAASSELAKLIRPNKKGEMLWIGYEPVLLNTRLSIWIYCENEKIACVMAKKLKPSTKNSTDKLAIHEDEKGNRTHLCIRGHSSYGICEEEWFIGWLHTVRGAAFYLNHNN